MVVAVRGGVVLAVAAQRGMNDCVPGRDYQGASPPEVEPTLLLRLE